MKRLACYFIILCMVASILPAAAQASQVHNSGCIASSESVETDFAEIPATVEQAPNRSDVIRITYNRLSSVDRLSVQLPSDVSIVRATGFTNETDAASVKYVGGDQAVLEYRIGTQNGGTQYANGSNWIFAAAPTHIGTGVDLEFKPAGVAGNDFIYIGNYTEYSTVNGCHEISLVNSEAGELSENPDRVINALGYTAKHLDVGHKYGDVTIFATPGFAKPPHPGFAGTSDAWVTKSTLSYPNMSHTRMILHEYIHTRQSYNQASVSDTTWITEGSADYLSVKYGIETDAISAERYNHWLSNGSNMNGSLSDRATWESNQVEYRRGGAYLAVLDQKIQTVSNNSVESVFRLVNSKGGERTHVIIQREMFLDRIENVSSPSVRKWANSSMDSTSPYNISSAKLETGSNGFLGQLGGQFEKRIAAQPYMGVLIAILLGILLGWLTSDISVGQDQEASKEAEE